MKRRILFIAGSIVALVAIAFTTIYLFSDRQGLPIPASTVDAISIEKPDLVVHGKYLSKVEVWAVPTGTGITDADYQKIGNATLSSSSAGGNERWTLPIPTQPILATQIFVKGYGPDGSLVGTVSLPEVGATSLYDALWGKSDATSTDLTLGVGKIGTFRDISITFNRLIQDSRCPVDVYCIEAGAVNTNVTFAVGTTSKTFNMPSDEVPQTFDSYRISIVRVDPPRKSKQDIAAGDYQITFHVEVK